MNNNNNPEKKEKKVALDESPVPHVKKGVAITAICLFLAVIILPSAVWGGCMIAENYAPGIMEKINPPTSEFEKHYLTFPTEFDPETITGDLEAWYNDNMPFRSIIFNTNEKIMTTFEKPYENKWRDVLITMFSKKNNGSNGGGDAVIGGESTESFIDLWQTTETEEVTTEVTETETLPSFPQNETTETETLPIFVEPIGSTETEVDTTETETTESETLPQFIETESTESETEPKDSETTETETLPQFIETETTETETIPQFIETETTETETLPQFVETETTEEETIPEFTESDELDNAGDENCEHVYTEEIITPATCTTNGIVRKTCTICNASKREYTAKAHSYSEEFTVIQAPTCTEYGIEGRKCQNCDAMTDQRYTAKAAHEFSEEFTVIQAPTCTEFGIEGRKCQNCDAMTDQRYTAKASHEFSEEFTVLQASTCTEYGIEGRKCANCDAATDQRYTAKADHAYGEGTVEKAATCSEVGTTLYVCSACEYEKRENIDKLPHSFGEDFVVIQAPTCTEYGIEGRKCANCDAATEQRYTPKADHAYGEGTVEKAATCSEVGTMLYVCSVCNGEKREDIGKLPHSFGEDFVVLQAPTCSDYGIEGRKCANCDAATEQKYTAKASHSYGAFEIEKPATCSDYGVQMQKCSACGNENREYVQKLAHNYVSNISSRPICGTSYTETLTCSNCNDSSSTQKTSTHEHGKRLKIVNATTETYGYTLVRCKHCDGEYRQDIKQRLTDNSNFLTINRSKTVNEGKFRWLFYLGDNSKAYYDGSNSLSEADMQNYAAILDQLNEICKEKGITLQVSIWPNKDQVYSEFTGYDNATLEGRKNTRTYKWVKYVQDNTDVKILYPLEELWAMKPYFDVYCKYDTHWNTAGGFIGYQAMLKSIGLESVNILDCPVFEYTGGAQLAPDHYYTQVRGDMLGLDGWSYSGNDYPNHRNYYVKYLPDVSATFVDGTDGRNGAGDIRHTVAENATYDKKFVMLADSFRVMQLGYLEKDFSDTYLCHRNQVNTDFTKASIKALGEGDILVIAAVERYDYDTVNTAQHIINILSE